MAGNYDDDSVEFGRPSGPRRWRFSGSSNTGAAAAGPSDAAGAAGPSDAAGAAGPSDAAGAAAIDPVSTSTLKPGGSGGSSSYPANYDSPNSSVRAKVLQLEQIRSSLPSSPSHTRVGSISHSRNSSGGMLRGGEGGEANGVAAVTDANGMRRDSGSTASARASWLEEEVEQLRKENNDWKRRMGQVTSGNGTVAVDQLVSELLDQNADLMERCGQLHTDNESLRQLRAEAAAASQQQQMQGPASAAGLSTSGNQPHSGGDAGEYERLREENELLRRGIGDRSAVLDKVDLTQLPEDAALEFVMLMTEVEDLKANLSELYEEKASAINEDNIALISQLTEENARLEDELAAFSVRLSSGGGEGPSQDDKMEHMGAEVKRLADEKQKFMEANRKLSERNSRLLQENDSLTEKLAVATAAAGGAAALGGAVAAGQGAARSAAEDAEHVVLLNELTVENSALLDETKSLSKRVNDLLGLNDNLISQNQDLTDRLYSVAFGGGDEDFLPATPATGGGRPDDQELRARYRQLEEQVKKDEEAQREAFERRLKLQAKGMRAVEAAKQRQEAQARASAGGVPAPPPEDPAVVAEREAKKREEREVARLALQTRLAEARKKREEEITRKQKEAVRKMREQEEEKRREDVLLNQYKKEAAEKVRKSYFQYAGKEDVGAFMRFLGYTFEAELSTNPDDDELRDAFKRAIVTTHPDRHVNGTLQQRALAEATYTRLQAWMRELQLS